METRDDYSKIMGALACEGGDYYIGTTAVANKRFTHIVIGPDGATVSEVKIRGVSVKSARNYGALPAGYVMCAGSGEYFDYIYLTSGNAQGLVKTENAYVLPSAVTVANGTAGAALTAAIAYTNDETKFADDTQEVTYKLVKSDGTELLTGTANIFFLCGSGSLTVNLTGLTYPSTVATGYKLKVKLSSQADSTYVEGSFAVTA